MAEHSTGYLVVKVLEVSGKDKEGEEAVWDRSLKDAFIKVEVRGGPRTVKKSTSTQPVVDGMITFEEDLVLDILEGSKELRIMLCRHRRGDEKPGTTVIAACGIFVSDILEAVPIDKFFDLFKPGQGAEGGFVRVSMEFVTPEQVQGNGSLAPALAAAVAQHNGVVEQPAEQEKRGSKRSRGFPIVRVSVAVALGALAAYLAVTRRREDKKPSTASAAAGSASAARKA
ncbi:hypothetical protein N2152v2_008148 [Parachlorella kessleri]